MSESIEPGMPRRPLDEFREGQPPPHPDQVPFGRPDHYDLRKPESYWPAFVAALFVVLGMVLFILFCMLVQWMA